MNNKIIAALLSIFIPGLGQLYGGQSKTKGIVFIIISLIFYCIGATALSLVWILSVIFSIYAAYDAYTKTS